jgi:hypothetical protein
MHINIFIFFLFMHINTHHIFTKIQTIANFYKMPANLYEHHDHGLYICTISYIRLKRTFIRENIF